MLGMVEQNLKQPPRGVFNFLILFTLLAHINPSNTSAKSTVSVASTMEEGVKSVGGEISGRPRIVQARVGDVLEVQEGEPVRLQCSSLTTRPNLELVWMNGRVASEHFDIQENINIMEDGHTWKTTSIFQFVPLEDQRVVCIAHSDEFLDPQHSLPLQLHLHQNPKVTLTSSSSTLKEGGDGTFHCKTTSSNVTFKWFLNDRELAGEQGEQLSLVDLRRDQDGDRLRCLVENSKGRSEASLMLEVNFGPKILHHPQSLVARKGQQVRKKEVCMS